MTCLDHDPSRVDAADLADRILSICTKLASGLRLSDQAPQLSGSQITLLAKVVEAGSVRPSELAVMLNRRSTAIARTISELVERDLIRREIDDQDRRKAGLKVTEVGLKLYRAEVLSRLSPIARHLEQLDGESMAALSRALIVLESLATR